MDQTLKVAVFAKYKFYFEDIKTAVKDYEILAEHFTSIDEFLKQSSIDRKTFKFLFFPHFSEIIPSEFLNMFECIGFHTGNLPHDRGGSPIQNKIIKGEYKSKVSAILLSSEVDGGPIYCDREIDLEFGSIEQILRNISILIAEMIIEIITSNLNPTAQIGVASYANRISKDNSRIDFSDLSIKQIYDRIRMVDGLEYPRAFVEVKNCRIFMESSKLENNKVYFNGIIEKEY